MRPTKLQPKLLKAFETVLNNEKYMRVCTDIELCHLINKQLDEEDQISYRTFQRYKLLTREHSFAATIKSKMREHYETYRQLYLLWMDARIAQKMKLMEMIENKVAGWQRYRWLLERKFTEFALNTVIKDDKSSYYMPTMDDIHVRNR